jgi:uncharacterized protein YfdQ (DUF2303 family)
MPDLDITTALSDYKKLIESQNGLRQVPGGTHPYLLVPDGYKTESLANYMFNDFAGRPHRTKQNVTVLDPESFIKYWQTFSDSESRIFGDRDGRRLYGVIDYHQPTGGPRWLSHTCTLQLRHTEEWKTWTGKNETAMCQADMALFIEDNAPDVVDPSAATMMEIARTLSVNQDVTFDSSLRLTDGSVSFSYREETKAAASGTFKVPERFRILIPVFEGMERVEIQARLRYRIPSGKLSMWYSLWRHAVAERLAFDQVMAKVSEACGSILIGKP